jgi:gluconate kinase
MLKRRYREVLVGDRADVRLIYLNGDETLIARRLAARDEHFMPARLLHGDFVALEGPGPTRIRSPSRLSRDRTRSWRK